MHECRVDLAGGDRRGQGGQRVGEVIRHRERRGTRADRGHPDPVTGTDEVRGGRARVGEERDLPATQRGQVPHRDAGAVHMVRTDAVQLGQRGAGGGQALEQHRRYAETEDGLLLDGGRRAARLGRREQ
jgi:hypothetical protein